LKVLVTGAAGFIGMHVCQRLAARGDEVIGLDNLNDYYDVSLKQARLAIARAQRGFEFVQVDITHRAALAQAFASYPPDHVIHLAAQVGVRNSLKDPAAYVDTNLGGFGNILEACRKQRVRHLVYASSSSVYGGNTRMPFGETDNVDHPVSLYAATKKANELMAHAYSHLYSIPTTGLRFFTVYGPWGRPDMAPILFARAIRQGHPVDVFNHGDMLRDFTYVDDAVEAVLRVCDKPAEPDPAFDRAAPNAASSNAPYRVFNVGNSQPVQLLDFIAALESALGRTAQKNLLPMQPGDVRATAADTAALEAWVGFRPATPLAEGVRRFAEWYLGHYPDGNKEAVQ
jgi:UDP-glucuronate 4-epimerase